MVIAFATLAMAASLARYLDVKPQFLGGAGRSGYKFAQTTNAVPSANDRLNS